jgi:hypothetical protein
MAAAERLGRSRARRSIAAVIIALVAAGCGGHDARSGGERTPVTSTTAGAGNGSVPVTVAGEAASITSPPGSEDAPTVTLAGPRTTAAATDEDPVPVGEVLEFTGLWDISVSHVDLDAAEEVLAFADINPEPAPGFRYVMVTIEGIYLGERVAQPVFEWAIQSGGETFEPSIPGCGVIPDSIYDVVEVVPGERFRANVCVPVPEASVAAGLQLYLQPPGDEPRYFALT